MGNAFQQKAVGRISGNDGRLARVASFFPSGLCIEKQSAFRLRRFGMTFVAFLREDRTDLRLEEFDLIG